MEAKITGGGGKREIEGARDKWFPQRLDFWNPDFYRRDHRVYHISLASKRYLPPSPPENFERSFKYREIKDDKERIEAENSDFTVVSENLLQKDMSKKWRLVGRVSMLEWIILSPNITRIITLTRDTEASVGYLEWEKATGKLFEHLAEVDFYPNLKTRAYSDMDSLAEAYRTGEIDLAILLTRPYDARLGRLTKLRRSHLVSPSSLNSGDIYSVTVSEEPFYRSYPSYQKTMLHMVDIYPSKYPYLSPFDDEVTVPTIGCYQVLLARKGLVPEAVKYVLNGLLIDLRPIDPRNQESLYTKPQHRAITPAISFNIISTIPFHKGARAEYRQRGLLLSGEDQHCIFYKTGHCPEEPDIDLIRRHGDWSQMRNLKYFGEREP